NMTAYVWSLEGGKLLGKLAGRGWGFNARGEALLEEQSTDGDHFLVQAVGAPERRVLLALSGQPVLAASGERTTSLHELGEHRRVTDVIDVETSAVLRRIPREGDAASLWNEALSAEGDRLAIGLEDGTVEVWEIPR